MKHKRILLLLIALSVVFVLYGCHKTIEPNPNWKLFKLDSKSVDLDLVKDNGQSIIRDNYTITLEQTIMTYEDDRRKGYCLFSVTNKNGEIESDAVSLCFGKDNRFKVEVLISGSQNITFSKNKDKLYILLDFKISNQPDDLPFDNKVYLLDSTDGSTTIYTSNYTFQIESDD